jgi:hypothetical protein
VLTKDILNKAISQNVLCFDDDQIEGELSYKLVGLMIDVLRSTSNEILTKLYIPCGIKWESEYYQTCCGLKVYQIPELNRSHPDSLLRYYLEDLEGFLYGNHKYLIVGTGPNCAVMLGSMR